MMKRKHVSLLLAGLIVLTLSTACQSEQSVQPRIETEEKQESPIKSEDAQQNVNKNKEDSSLIDDSFIANLAQGKIKYCEFPVDDSITADDILKRLGPPEVEGFYNGGYGRQYGNCTYFTERDKPDSRMTAIIYVDENLTQNANEIKKKLGPPTEEGIDEMEGNYFLYYESGNHAATFSFESEEPGPVQNIFIK